VALVDGRLASVPAVTAGVADTVGAGDSFDAGFLAGWLTGRDVEASLALGAACGALSLRGAGGTGWQPTLDEALAAAGAAPRP
jgi:sugar/nucleoside kinase (ribokinase family)